MKNFNYDEKGNDEDTVETENDDQLLTESQLKSSRNRNLLVVVLVIVVSAIIAVGIYLIINKICFSDEWNINCILYLNVSYVNKALWGFGVLGFWGFEKIQNLVRKWNSHPVLGSI